MNQLVTEPRQLAPIHGGRWPEAFRALRHRDFRRLMIGQIVSLSGTHMQSLALLWLVYRLTHSALLMGAIGFCSYIPVLVLGPVAGVVADRFSRQRIVLATQMAFLVQASALAILTLTNTIGVVHIALLAMLFGAINAFDIPGRQALYIHLVGKDDLSNAIALNSMTFNSARIVGPAIGGFFVAAFGEGICFLANAVTYVVVIALLLTMHSSQPEREAGASALERLREGFRYAWHHRQVRMLLIVAGIANIAFAPINVLGPVFADAIFHRGSQGLGILTGSLGVGAVIGTFALARQRDSADMESVVWWSASSLAVSLMVFAVSIWFPLSMAAMFLAGFSVFRQLAGTNTLIQSRIEDEFRGRTMALYSMMVVGMLPIGNLLAGVTAHYFGVRATVFAGGVLCVLAGALWKKETTA